MSALEKLAMLKSEEKSKRLEEEKTYLSRDQAKNGDSIISALPSGSGRTYSYIPSPDQQSRP